MSLSSLVTSLPADLVRQPLPHRKQVKKRTQNTHGVKQRLASAGLSPPAARVRGRVRIKSHVFILLCHRLAVALVNYHRGNEVASSTITL